MTDEPHGAELEPATVPQTSTQKVWRLILFLQDADDGELADTFPFRVPTALLRTALAAAGDALPNDDQELDVFLTGVADFCLSLRSDGHHGS